MSSKFRIAGLVSTGSIESNGNLILTGGIYMTNGTGDEINWESETNLVVSAQNSIQFKLDSDNDTSGAQFMITDNAGNIQHVFYEDGRAIFNNAQNSPGLIAVKGSTDLGLVLADLNNNVAALGSTANTIVGRPDIGTDVKVLLSGTVGSTNTGTRGATLNAGDLVVSGNTHLKNNLFLTGNIYIKSDDENGINIGAENDFKISANGNVKVLVDSDDDNSNGFFSTEGIAGSNFVSYEHGQNIFNLARQADGDFFVRGSTGYSLLHVDAGENAVAIGESVTTPFVRTGVGTDVKTSIFGIDGSKDGATRGVTLIIGDTVISGATHLNNDLSVTGSIETTGDISLLANNSLRFNNPGQNDQFINGNNATITLDADDGIILKSDSYIYHSINDTTDNIFTTTQTVFNFNRDDIDFRVNTDDYYGTIFVDANDNTVILGNQGFDSTPLASEVPGYGTDVKLYLSGTTGTKDSATRGVTLVAGDMVVSGATHLQSDLFITGNIRMQSSHNDGISIDAENNFELSSQGSVIFTIDSDNDSASGRYFGVKDGAGTFSIVAYEQGDVVINNSLLSTNDFFVKGDTNHSAIFVDASEDAVALGRLLSTDFGSEPGVGADVKLLLSGAAGSRGTGTRGATLVAGDLVVSGSSHLAASNFTSTQVLILSGGSTSSPDPAGGSDVNFFVSGAIGSRGTATRGTSIFGGDVYISGSLYSKQRQVYSTGDRHLDTTEFFLDLGFSGNGDASFESNFHQILAPFAGTVKKVMVRSDTGNSNALNVKVYSSAGSDAITGGTSTTKAIVVNSANTTVQDDIGHGFTEGQAIAVSVQRNPAPGNINITLVVEYNIHS